MATPAKRRRATSCPIGTGPFSGFFLGFASSIVASLVVVAATELFQRWRTQPR